MQTGIGSDPHPENQYLDLLRQILRFGEKKVDRTGVGTLSVLGAMQRYDLADDVVPMLTTKRIPWKTAAKEMLWMLRGETNIQSLLRDNVTIWSDWPLAKYRKETGDDISQSDFEARICEDDDFAAAWGDLGPVYGKQWRRWLGPDGKEHDQISALIESIRKTPASRRLLFHGWNIPDIADMALPPCHLLYQFTVSNGRTEPRDLDGMTAETISGEAIPQGKPRLNGICYLRSSDTFLGLGFNTLNLAILTRMIAQQCDMEPGEIVMVLADAHTYTNHIDQVQEQLRRDPRPFPTLKFVRKPESIDDYRIEDFVVEGYDPHPVIKAPVAV